ncbi:MAG: amidohydrolase family protein [Candidatus Hydrogenedentes bacterium]|nr:amidohydrolase family protein [Candidatus Hydrogenedentota bacterium]
MSGQIIDVNASLSRWPLRRLAWDEPAALVAELRGLGITQAWCGSFDALLHKDIEGVNARLAEACAASDGFLLPFGAVNPMLPDWEEDLRRCAELYQMPGIRLHPNYHGYTLEQPVLAEVLRQATARKLLVQLTVTLEDERMMHPLLRVPPVDCAPLPGVLTSIPDAQVLLLNAVRTVPRDLLRRLAVEHGVYCEIATVEGLGGVANLLEDVPLEQVLFGSHAPLFYPVAAVLKLKESALAEAQLAAVTMDNARRLLNPQ